jgi:hypothetical protein
MSVLEAAKLCMRPMAKKPTITSYDWGEGNLIRHIDVREQNSRAVAYLYADDGSAKLGDLRHILSQHGLSTLAEQRDGKFALRVSGLRNSDELLRLLRTSGFATNQPHVKAREEQSARPKGFFDWVKTNSLIISGRLYTLGNLMYVASGFARGKDIGQIGTGVAFGTGDFILAAAGEKDDGRQLTSLLKKLKTHYERDGIAIPQDASIHTETSDKDKGFGERTRDFLHKYVNQIKCFGEVVGGGFYYWGGAQQGNKWKQRTAVIFGTGFGASMVIPEKKIDEDKYAHAGPLKRAWMKIQSNPLSIGGISGLSNTLFTTIGAFDERKRYLHPGVFPDPINKKTGEAILATKHYKWDFAIPAVMLFANILYAASKKTTGGDIREGALVQDLYSSAAEILNGQPAVMREAAIESTAEFLGQRPEIKDKRPEIIVRLKKEMELQRQNPWSGPVPGQPQTAAPANRSAPPSPQPQPVVNRAGLEHAVIDPQLIQAPSLN